MMVNVHIIIQPTYSNHVLNFDIEIEKPGRPDSGILSDPLGHFRSAWGCQTGCNLPSAPVWDVDSCGTSKWIVQMDPITSSENGKLWKTSSEHIPNEVPIATVYSVPRCTATQSYGMLCSKC